MRARGPAGWGGGWVKAQSRFELRSYWVDRVVDRISKNFKLNFTFHQMPQHTTIHSHNGTCTWPLATAVTQRTITLQRTASAHTATRMPLNVSAFTAQRGYCCPTA